MAKDKLSIRLEGGAKLDRVLAKMALTHQSAASKIVFNSLKSGASTAGKAVKAKAPKDTQTLKKSIKNGLRRKVNVPRNVFMAAVFFKFKRDTGDTGDGGWYSIFNIRRHKKNAFGSRGGNDFVTPAVKSSEGAVRKTIGTKLALKIAAFNQKQINKLG